VADVRGDYPRGVELLARGAEFYRGRDKERWKACLNRLVQLGPALSKKVPDSVIPDFGRALVHYQVEGKKQILQYVSSFGARARPLLPTLRAIKEDADQEVALAAFRALRQIEGAMKKGK
jgi:hypothetical protein